MSVSLYKAEESRKQMNKHYTYIIETTEAKSL